jgi:toxin ParE1/3/4
VSGFRFSPLAERDLADIADYSTDIWGEAQADRYLDELSKCFARIAANHALGRRCDSLHRGFRRIESGKHVIFYEPQKQGVYISRILHQSMLPNRHDIIGDES